jgi:hypothetical protein
MPAVDLADFPPGKTDDYYPVVPSWIGPMSVNAMCHGEFALTNETEAIRIGLGFSGAAAGASISGLSRLASPRQARTYHSARTLFRLESIIMICIDHG